VDAVADPELQANKEKVLGAYKQAVGDDVEGLYRVATTINQAGWHMYPRLYSHPILTQRNTTR
jgi:hypothetical protein